MIERFVKDNKTYIIGYHSQECRYTDLEAPIKCTSKEAWLGVGFYFWVEEEFAKYWGEDFKKGKNGFYDIYKANLEVDNLINAVFDEKGYYFFRKCIEDAILHFNNNGKKVSLEQVTRFLADNFWKKLNVTGIIYDDIPVNPQKKERVYSEIFPLYYKKRIQIVVFNLKNINNFEIYLTELC